MDGLADAFQEVLRQYALAEFHNARSILWDLRNDGPTVWDRFSADRDEQLWYYRASELDRVVDRGCGMSVKTEKNPARNGPIGPGEELCHLVEDDPDRALCGKDVTGFPWNPPWPYCVVCVDLAKQRGWGGL